MVTLSSTNSFDSQKKRIYLRTSTGMRKQAFHGNGQCLALSLSFVQSLRSSVSLLKIHSLGMSRAFIAIGYDFRAS